MLFMRDLNEAEGKRLKDTTYIVPSNPDGMF